MPAASRLHPMNMPTEPASGSLAGLRSRNIDRIIARLLEMEGRGFTKHTGQVG
jgi:hypothetical protein